eukprot:4151917-Lingulodinium_polyedra.AAC.1
MVWPCLHGVCRLRPSASLLIQLIAHWGQKGPLACTWTCWRLHALESPLKSARSEKGWVSGRAVP